MAEYIQFIQNRVPLYKDGSRFFYGLYDETELFINEHPDSKPLKHLEEAIKVLCSQIHFKNDVVKMEQILNSLPPIVCQGWLSSSYAKITENEAFN